MRPYCPPPVGTSVACSTLLSDRACAERDSMTDLNEQWLAPRPSAPGKFLYAGGQKLWVKGVTYGTFRPGGPDDALFPLPAIVKRDFAQIAGAGFNTVRTYTSPPPWLLDVAADNGLSVLAGLCVAAARDVSGRSAARAQHRAHAAGDRAPVCGSPGAARRRHRQRDSRADRALAWRGGHREASATPLRRSQGRRSRRTGHVRELPDDRVSRSARSSTLSASTSTWRPRIGWRPTSLVFITSRVIGR